MASSRVVRTGPMRACALVTPINARAGPVPLTRIPPPSRVRLSAFAPPGCLQAPPAVHVGGGNARHSSALRARRALVRTHASKSTKQQENLQLKTTPGPAQDKAAEAEGGWLAGAAWLEGWDVPWGFGRVVGGMGFWVVAFVLAGLGVQVTVALLHLRVSEMSPAQQSLFVCSAQFTETVAALAVVNTVVKKFRPLPENFLKFDLRAPFAKPDGWAAWGLAGYFSTFVVVAATTALLAGAAVDQTQGSGTVDNVMPLVSAGDPLDTVALLLVTSVFAPLAEEYVFRGFLLASLTKWIPTPAAVLVSAALFSGAHFAPRDAPQLFALGIVLGSFYVRTKNLATPMLIHSMWNSGVLVFLFFLQANGISLVELLEAEAALAK